MVISSKSKLIKYFFFFELSDGGNTRRELENLLKQGFYFMLLNILYFSNHLVKIGIPKYLVVISDMFHSIFLTFELKRKVSIQNIFGSFKHLSVDRLFKQL